MNPRWCVLRKVLFGLALGAVAVGTMAASNECHAKVTVLSATPKGGGMVVAFDVKTSCEASQGRFEYSFESSQRPGVQVTRRVPMWNAAKGKAFTWTDEIPSAASVANVKVVADSIESTKL